MDFPDFESFDWTDDFDSSFLDIDVEDVVYYLNQGIRGKVCDVVSEIPESCAKMSPSAWYDHYHNVTDEIGHRGLDELAKFQPIVYKDNIHSDVYIVLANKNDQIKAILKDFFGDCHLHIMPYISYFIHYYCGKEHKPKKIKWRRRLTRTGRLNRPRGCSVGCSWESLLSFDTNIQKKQKKKKKKCRRRLDSTGRLPPVSRGGSWDSFGDSLDINIQISGSFENKTSLSAQNRRDNFETEGSFADIFASFDNKNSSSNQKRRENAESGDSLLDSWTMGSSLENNASNASAETCSQNDDFSAFISKNCKKDSDHSINPFAMIDTSSQEDIMSPAQANSSFSRFDLAFAAYDSSKEESKNARADPFANLFDIAYRNAYNFENAI